MGLLSAFAAGFLVLFMFFEGMASPETVNVSFHSVCPLKSVKDSIFRGVQDLTCPLDGIQSSYVAEVIQVYTIISCSMFCIVFFSLFLCGSVRFWVLYFCKVKLIN